MRDSPRPHRSLRAAVPIALVAVLGTTALSAQNQIMAGLQGDPAFSTPGGWIWPAAPAGNPFPFFTTSYLKNKIALGKALFWDEQVSTSNSMACGTCHFPEAGGTDLRKPGMTFNSSGQPILGAFGVVPQSMPGAQIVFGFSTSPQETRRVTEIQVPTMIGAYMFNTLFWMRTAGPQFLDSGGFVLFPAWAALEDQSVNPPTSPNEMGHEALAWATGVIEKKLGAAAPLALAVPGSVPPSIPAAWLTTTYKKLFDSIFAVDPNPAIAAPNGVTRERFAMAIAEYERTLVPDQAPIDTNRMTVQEQQGFDLFVQSGCVFCHSVSQNPQLVNRFPASPVIGTLANPWDNPFSDGLSHDIFASPAGLPRSIGRIKTPTLRNVGLRNRFFHDGRGRVVGGVSLNTLPDIVDFYDIDQDPANGGLGGIFELRGAGPTLTPAERAAVIAFLGNALTDPRVKAASFPFDRPKLFSESVPFNSNHTKPATAAVAGWKPLMIAHVPPLVDKVGGPIWWKIGVGSNGAGAGTAPVIPTGSSAILYLGATDTGGGPFWLTGITPLTTLLTSAQGFATAQNPVPLTASMIGTTSFLQWVVLNPTFTDTGFSEAARFTPF